MDEQHIIHLLKKISDALPAVINYIRFIHLKWSKNKLRFLILKNLF